MAWISHPLDEDWIRNDNGKWRWEMLTAEYGEVVFADHPVDLLEYLLPGYAQASDDDRLTGRITIALEVVTDAQERALRDLADVCRPLTASERAAALSDKWMPCEPVIEHWEPDTPLYLVDAAFTDEIFIPVGSAVTVVRTLADDETFLGDLAACGAIYVKSVRR